MSSSAPAHAESAYARHRLFADQTGMTEQVVFPFETALSLAPLLAHWRAVSEAEPATYAEAWHEIERDLAGAPALADPVLDPALLDRYDDLISRLVRPLFPGSEWTTEARALAAPFGGRVLFRTERYERTMGRHAASTLEAINGHDAYIRTLYAYKAILGRFYGVELRLDQPLIFVVPDEDSGLSHYFKLNASSQFATVEVTGSLPPLSPADIEEMLQNVGDLGLWQEKLPSERFRFVGLTLMTLTDVTHETATAAITHLVLTSDANVTEDNFEALEQEVRTLFGVGSLRMGLASLQANGALNVRSERRIWNSLVIRDAVRAGALDWQATPYARALRDGQPVVIRDVEQGDLDASLRAHLRERGVRGLFLQPLHYDDRTVGLFELSTPDAGVFDASTILKMRRIKSIFALAVYQNLERFETRVESAIQHAYTAIHPSVLWRFREAAIEGLERGATAAEPAPIVFEEVFPLYGAADIRSSTRHRNEAVQADALQQLRRARASVRAVQAALPLTILDELALRLDRRIEQCDAVWNAGDEAEVMRFLSEDVEPLIEAVAAGRDDLRDTLDPVRGSGETSGPERSKLYEESRRQINRVVSDVLLAEQDEAQTLFPHYFEHAKTDGVEHAMYIGASIAPTLPFTPAFVQNLRLRQLVAACTIAREVRHLNETLAVPLDIAQLVIVQHAPVTLRFRADEKRFDVEGASGVRFELLKKRLDKARVMGSDERITQPDTVAVVYSTAEEEAEYRRYAEYLVANESIEGDPDVLDVEDLPGATGLKMLRLQVQI